MQVRIATREPAARVYFAGKWWYRTGREAAPLGRVYNMATDYNMLFEYEDDATERRWFDIDGNVIREAVEVID